MGGCATKPKVLTGDDRRDEVAPAPVPSSPPAPLQKEEAVDTAVKEAVVENDTQEGVPASADHDSTTKNSSLGNLFKENQEGKDSGEKEKETVKVADVSETTNTPKEVEKTIPEDSDSSLKKNNAEAEEKKTEEEKVEVEVMGEVAEKKKPDEAMVNIVTPEEQNLDDIKPRITDPEDKKAEEKVEIPQKQEEEEEKEQKKETEESMKHNPPLPPPPAAADQEKFATPKEKQEDNNATPKVVEVEEEDKKKKPE